MDVPVITPGQITPQQAAALNDALSRLNDLWRRLQPNNQPAPRYEEFNVQVTAVDSSTPPNYTATEQSFSASTSEYLTSPGNPRVLGPAIGTGGVNAGPLRERNNQVAPSFPFYALARRRQLVGGTPYYEFDLPTTVLVVQVTSTTPTAVGSLWYFPAQVMSLDSATGVWTSGATVWYADSCGNWPLINSFHVCEVQGQYTNGGDTYPVCVDSIPGGQLVIVQVTSISLGSGGYPAQESIWNQNGLGGTGDVCWYLDANGNAPTLNSYHLCLQTGNDGSKKIYQDAVNGGGSFTATIGALTTPTSGYINPPWPVTSSTAIKLAVVTGGTTANDQSGVFLNDGTGPGGAMVLGTTLCGAGSPAAIPGTISINTTKHFLQQLGDGNKSAPQLFAAFNTTSTDPNAALNYQGFFASSVLFTGVGAISSKYYLGEQITPTWVGYGGDSLTITNTVGGGPHPVTGADNTGLSADLIQLFVSPSGPGQPQILLVGGGASSGPLGFGQITISQGTAADGTVFEYLILNAQSQPQGSPPTNVADGYLQLGFQSCMLGGLVSGTPAQFGVSNCYYGINGPSGNQWGIWDMDLWGNVFSGGLTVAAANFTTLNTAYIAAGGGGTLPGTGAQILAALWTALNGLGAAPW